MLNLPLLRFVQLSQEWVWWVWNENLDISDINFHSWVLVRVYPAFTYHFGILLGGKVLETMDYPKGKFASAANTMTLSNALNVASQILK